MTTARVAVEEDRHRRMRNYLLAMGLRIVGFPLSVWLLLNGYLVPGVILAAVATVIPSIAVVVANAVDRRGSSPASSAPTSPVQGLGPGAVETEAREQERDGSATPPAEQIRGTVVSRRETPYPAPRTDPGTEDGDDDGPAEPGTAGWKAS